MADGPAVEATAGGSGLEFEDRGSRELNGVPGEWWVYALADPMGRAT
jgi:hypothetical protein